MDCTALVRQAGSNSKIVSELCVAREGQSQLRVVVGCSISCALHLYHVYGP